jgi:hypothetical protein
MSTYYVNAGSVTQDGLTPATGYHTLTDLVGAITLLNSDVVYFVDNGVIQEPASFLALPYITISSYVGNINKPTWNLDGVLYLSFQSGGVNIYDIKITYAHPSYTAVDFGLFGQAPDLISIEVSRCELVDVRLVFTVTPFVNQNSANLMLKVTNNVFYGDFLDSRVAYLEQITTCCSPFYMHDSTVSAFFDNNTIDTGLQGFVFNVYSYEMLYHFRVLGNILSNQQQNGVLFRINPISAGPVGPNIYDIEIDYNDVFNCAGVAFAEDATTYVGHENIYLDPYFVDASANNFRLKPDGLFYDNPCIRTSIGSSIAPSVPLIDFDSSNRQTNVTDMGAFQLNIQPQFFDDLLGSVSGVVGAKYVGTAMVGIPGAGSTLINSQTGWAQPINPSWNDADRNDFHTVILSSGTIMPPQPGDPPYTTFEVGLWDTSRSGIGAVYFGGPIGIVRYWVATVPSNWNNTANWDSTWGGSGGASVPIAGATVFFDASGSIGLAPCDVDVPVIIDNLIVAPSYDSTDSIITQNHQNFTVANMSVFDGGIFQGDSSPVYTGSTYLGYGIVKDAIVHISQDMTCASTHNQWTVSNNSNLIMDGIGLQNVLIEAAGVVPTLTVNKFDENHVMCFGASPIVIKDSLLISDGTLNTNGLDVQVGI